jgi:hypothetical protein
LYLLPSIDDEYTRAARGVALTPRGTHH